MSPDQSENSTRRSVDGLRTRVSLLQRASDGSDQLAWEELLKFYEPFISKVLQAMGFRGPDLDDARQQVSLALWKGYNPMIEIQSAQNFALGLPA